MTVMNKPLSLICCTGNKTISAIEVGYPISISEMCSILRSYNNANKVERLIALGNLYTLDHDILLCDISGKDETLCNISINKFMDICRDYPYVYIFEKSTNRWYFYHEPSEIYKHEKIIPLSEAEDLQAKGALFSMLDK